MIFSFFPGVHGGGGGGGGGSNQEVNTSTTAVNAAAAAAAAMEVIREVLRCNPDAFRDGEGGGSERGGAWAAGGGTDGDDEENLNIFGVAKVWQVYDGCYRVDRGLSFGLPR